MRAIGIEAVGVTKRFGAFTALDDVSLKIAKASVHALLGENGAGKSTLVKCLLGYYQADEGSFIVDAREELIERPADADRLGLGMVYQHFTLVPSMTAAENLVMARADVPRVIDWKAARQRLLMRASVAGGGLPRVDSLRREGGTVYLQQSHADAGAGLAYLLGRHVRIDLGYDFTYFFQREKSPEDDNLFELIDSGVRARFTVRF